MTVLQNIYENVGKTTDTFSNEFKLLLGWNNLKITSPDDERVTNAGTENAKVTVSKEEMEESIKSIFGSNVKYTDETFDNTENKPFWQSRSTAGIVEYSNGVYTAKFVEGGGSDYPYIGETIEKAIQYNDKVEIYVKTGFCVPNENGDVTIYSDFDMKNEVGKLSNDLDMPNDEDILSKLDAYVYIFDLDNTTGEYYFAGFAMSEI